MLDKSGQFGHYLQVRVRYQQHEGVWAAFAWIPESECT